MTIEIKNKYMVYNKKYLNDVNISVQDRVRIDDALALLNSFIPEGEKYYVCNVEELYSDKVFQVMKDGENLKRESCHDDCVDAINAVTGNSYDRYSNFKEIGFK